MRKLRYDLILSLPYLEGTEITLQVKPQPAPRLNRGSKYGLRAKRYYAYKDDLRKSWPSDVDFPSDILIVQFGIPMPKSWSKKKKESLSGKPHLQKPDTDNLVKAIKDTFLKDDSGVYSEFGEKIWSKSGGFIKVVSYSTN